jgi:hypothetical protein
MSISISMAENGAAGFLLRFDRAEQPVFILANNAFKKIVGRENIRFDEQNKLWLIEAEVKPDLDRFLAGATAWLMAEVQTVDKNVLKRTGCANDAGFDVSFEAEPRMF